MRNKGIVALLDGLLAYTVAFVCVGFLVLLMTNTQEEDIKTSYSLNVWAEDLADAIGMSMVNASNPPVSYSQAAWLSRTDPAIIENLNTSLKNIAADKNLDIVVVVDDNYLVMPVGNIAEAKEIASAKRLLIEVDSAYNSTGETSVLEVYLGALR